MLRGRRTSLTVLAKVVGPLNSADDPVALLESIDGKSQREVEQILACGRPVAKPVERVRRQVVRKPAAAAAPLLDGGAEASSGGASGADVATANGTAVATSGAEVASDSGCNRTSAAEASASSSAGPTSARTSAAETTTATEATAEHETEERVSLSFSLTAEDYESFEQAKAILARKLPADMSLEDAFNELVAFYLAKKAPTRKPKKGTRKKASDGTTPPRSTVATVRGQVNRSSTGIEIDSTTAGDGKADACPGSESVPGTEAAISTDTSSRPAPEPRSRHVPIDTRAAVFDRDGHRCTFVAADGTRCRATRNLQIDHVQPFARGGSHEDDNLRVLCAAHNRRAAERVFGPLPRRKSGGARGGTDRRPTS
jgi:5-methylcytosine-specific restriction endonuclease McrA